MDPENVYAHAMWCFEVLKSGGALGEAMAHFTRALASKREAEYVRQLQISALFWHRTAEAEDEVVRVANDIRASSPTMPGDRSPRSDLSRLWDVYRNQRGPVRVTPRRLEKGLGGRAPVSPVALASPLSRRSNP